MLHMHGVKCTLAAIVESYRKRCILKFFSDGLGAVAGEGIDDGCFVSSSGGFGVVTVLEEGRVD